MPDAPVQTPATSARLFAELVGTFVLVFGGVGTAVFAGSHVGFLGVALAFGLTVVTVTGIVCIAADRLLGGSGIAGAAASSTAGNSAAVPQAVALADPSFAAVAPAATVQVTASVIVTAILTPLLTAWWSRRLERSRAADPARDEAAPSPVAPAKSGVI